MSEPMRDPSSDLAAIVAAAAADYCGLIDTVAEIPATALPGALLRALARLYAAAVALPPSDDLPAPDDATGASVWANRYEGERFAALAALLGSIRRYREFFDPWDFGGDAEVGGDLAEDVWDVYRDVREGLEHWQAGRRVAALWTWRFTFEVHWGEHATGALRALHARASLHQGGWR